jgi:hypothetical protein
MFRPHTTHEQGAGMAQELCNRIARNAFAIRHSRERGNPVITLYYLDSRFRGNDGLGIFGAFFSRLCCRLTDASETV